MRKKDDRMLMVLLLYSAYSFLTDLSIILLAKNNLLTSNYYSTILSLFTIVEFVSFSLLFLLIFKKSIIKKIIISAIVVFIPICLFNYFLQKNRNTNIDTIPITFQAIFFMSLAIYYFLDQIKNPTIYFIYYESEFWIITSILIYLSGTFFIYLFSSNLTQNDLDRYWFINYLFNILKNILIAMVFLLRRNNQKNISNQHNTYTI
jgi:hypothetical protein